MADDVTGVVTNSGHFALDQRSLIKKIADVLRNRAYIYSIYQNADQIDYIDGKDPLSENRTCWQNFIRRITKSCYPYDDVEDFKKKNPEYLSKQLEKCQTTVAIHEATIAQHVATLEQNRNLIEQKEKLINDQQSAIVQHAGTVNGHLQTIVQYEERLQNEKQKKEQARPRQIEADRRDKEYVRKVEKLLLRVIDLEDLYAGSPFASRAHENSTSSSSNSSNQNLSPLHLLAEATQYQVMARLEWLQKVADSSEHVNQAEITAGQIKTQMAEAWKADYQLAERLAKLASKKELLWALLNKSTTRLRVEGFKS
jgi:hypothetical protein